MIFYLTEDRLAVLMKELESKRSLLASGFSESEEMTSRILLNLEKKNGLCIRLLEKNALSEVLQYLGGTHSSASMVCKYWRLCAIEGEKGHKKKASPVSAVVVGGVAA